MKSADAVARTNLILKDSIVNLIRKSIAVALLLSCRLFAQSETVAILPFEAPGGVDSTTASAVTEFVQNAFAQHSIYKVLERKQIQKILREQSFQLTGATESAVEAGKLLAVNRIAIGSITKLGKEFTLVMNLVDVETGEVLKSEKKSAQISIEDIDNILIDPMVELLLSVKRRSGFTLVVKKGTGIHKKDALSESDVWVQVSVGNQLVGRTEKIQDSNSPEFNDRFDVSEYSGEPIILTVYDHDVNSEDLIGNVTISGPKSGRYPIIGTIDGQNYNLGQIEVVFE